MRSRRGLAPARCRSSRSCGRSSRCSPDSGRPLAESRSDLVGAPSQISAWVESGYPLRRYARLVGAPNSAPSLRLSRGSPPSARFGKRLRGHPASPWRVPRDGATSSSRDSSTRSESGLDGARTNSSRRGWSARAYPLIPRTNCGREKRDKRSPRSSIDVSGKEGGGPRSGFAKRARGGDPRPSRARERS